MFSEINKLLYSLIRRFFIRLLLKKGHSGYFAPVIFDQRVDDLFRNKETIWKQKIWAQKRGFLSDKLSYYGLTEENYKDYLSDFDHWRLYPLNERFSHWIDDKLTMKLILHPFSEHLPEYYYFLYDNKIVKLSDLPKGFEQSINGVINLTKDKKTLAMKLVYGSEGIGFYKIEFINGDYLINNEITDENSLRMLIESWKKHSVGYLITEYLFPHPDLKKIWSKTSNSLRLSVIHHNNQQPQIIGCFIKFGTEATGTVDNVSSGGLFSMVDLNTGYFNQGKIVVGRNLKDSPRHPNSGRPIEGYIPFWKDIKTKIIEICNYLPELFYLGIDVIITQDTFKIIEINSHPIIKTLQSDTPIYKNQFAAAFLKIKLLRNCQLAFEIID
jgi:hypothetical protein